MKADFSHAAQGEAYAAIIAANVSYDESHDPIHRMRSTVRVIADLLPTGMHLILSLAALRNLSQCQKRTRTQNIALVYIGAMLVVTSIWAISSIRSGAYTFVDFDLFFVNGQQTVDFKAM
jgi:K+-sensing histidine kinase KdpD